MRAEPFIVAPGAKIPLSLLSTGEKRELKFVVSQPIGANTRRTDKGHFVSRLGKNKRVLWELGNDKTVKILSIIEKSDHPFK